MQFFKSPSPETYETIYQSNHYISPHLSELLKNNFELAFKLDTSIGALSTINTRASLLSTGNKISREEWEKSEYFIPTVNFFDGMTDAYAANLYEGKRRIDYLRYLNAKSTGLGKGIIKFGGQILANLIDPINFIPFVGIGSKIASVTKIGGFPLVKKVGTTLSRSPLLKGAVEVGIASAAVEPFIQYNHTEIGDSYTFAQSIMNIGLGAAFGATFGHVLGNRTRKKILTDMSQEGQINATKAFSSSVQHVANSENAFPSPSAREVMNDAIQLNSDNIDSIVTSDVIGLSQSSSEIYTNVLNENVINADIAINAVAIDPDSVFPITSDSIGGVDYIGKTNQVDFIKTRSSDEPPILINESMNDITINNPEIEQALRNASEEQLNELRLIDAEIKSNEYIDNILSAAAECLT